MYYEYKPYRTARQNLYRSWKLYKRIVLYNDILYMYTYTMCVLKN